MAANLSSSSNYCGILRDNKRITLTPPPPQRPPRPANALSNSQANITSLMMDRSPMATVPSNIRLVLRPRPY
ncbi:hypothetical protein CVS40_8007 [Lucilia cuprina]|nr:hypothetical protein CVS40_8007 [Lucilia cuprina]